MPNPFMLPAMISAGAQLGGSLINAFGGGGDDDQPYQQITQLPEYPESEKARQDWASKLTQWGEDPYYGAIQQDWGSIWENAQNKVRQYFWGGAADEGIAGKIKSSVARRGMQDSPAMEEELLKLGALESDQLKDLSVSQGIQRTNLANQGKQDWMAGISGLASMKPAFATSSGITEGSGGMGDLISGVGTSVGGAMMQNAQSQQRNDWLEKLLKNNSQSAPNFGDVYQNTGRG